MPNAPIALKDYRRELLRRLGPSMGIIAPMSAATAQTVTCNTLAVGTVASSKYEGMHLLRAEATGQPADRWRVCSAFNSQTGAFSQTGAAYADTTATSEYLEVLAYEPMFYDQAIDIAVKKLHRLDSTSIYCRFDTTDYFLKDIHNDYYWINEAADIVRVTYTTNPRINNNTFFEDWNKIDASGNPTSDYFTISGAGATVARSGLNNRRGAWTAAVTRAGADAKLTVEVGLQETGVTQTTGDTLRNKPVTVVGVGTASSANQLRFAIYDGTQTVYTSYHSGGGNIEELSALCNVSASATLLEIWAEVNTTDGTVYLDELYCIPISLTDPVRRNTWPESEVPWEFDQGAGTPALILPRGGMYGSYIVYSKRPYPGFDSTRLMGGLADNDTSDAPLMPVVEGALSIIYKGLSEQGGIDATRYRTLYVDHEKKFQRLALDHISIPEAKRGGYNWPKYAGIAARRF